MRLLNGVCLLLSLIAFPALAADSGDQVSAASQFMGATTTKLYEGSDSQGNCRLLVYTQSDSERTQLWLEGTFQKNDGVVAGVPIVFLLSSSSSDSRIEAFEVDDRTLFASVTYPSENSNESDITMSILVTKDQGWLSSVAYETLSGKRTCTGLKRTL